MTCSACGTQSPTDPCTRCAAEIHRIGSDRATPHRANDHAGNCARGCLHWRRHLEDCPVDNGQDGAWVSIPLDDDRREQHDLDSLLSDHLAMLGLNRNRYGGIEEWVDCRGCQPREAKHGALCGNCHTRIEAWLKTDTRELKDVDVPGFKMTNCYLQSSAEGSIAWAYDWLASDMEPRQQAAGLDKIMQGKKVPPAALALHIHDLRQELAAALGEWLRLTCLQFGLTGPDWWRQRVDSNQVRRDDYRRCIVPQTQAEVTAAQRFLSGWLERIEDTPELALAIYEQAENLMVRVASIAPWRAKPHRLPGLACPCCDREALVRFDGDEHLTCRRCGELVQRTRYDVWAYSGMQERMAG